jgi:hypothetical protein
MPLNKTALVADQLAQLILRRFDMRDSDRKLTKSELRKVETVAESAVESGHDPISAVKAFTDFMLPVSGRFASPRNLYFEWRNFKDEHLSMISQLFPITDADEDLFTAFKNDWVAVAKDHTHLNPVYHRRWDVRTVKAAKLYRGTPDFWRIIGLIRHYQPEFMQANQPLFTLRSFLAAQLETLCGFVDRMQIGHLTSEKAHERYADWYNKAFYPAELVNKARKRPSANNPVCTSSIRREYEQQRIASGSRIGVFTFEGERSLPFHNVPLIYNEPVAPVEAKATSTSIVVPPSARE